MIKKKKAIVLIRNKLISVSQGVIWSWHKCPLRKKGLAWAIVLMQGQWTFFDWVKIVFVGLLLITLLQNYLLTDIKKRCICLFRNRYCLTREILKMQLCPTQKNYIPSSFFSIKTGYLMKRILTQLTSTKQTW